MSDNHGNTPAAWSAVVVGLLGFLVGSVGVVIENMTLFWVGIALLPVALIVAVVMSKLGMGAESRSTR